jgi:putative FmdB family regulatory protein
MPFYEYECSACKYYTEVLQKLSDPVLKKCPSCGKSAFKKLVSAPVFRLKGSGWYETDFKGDKDSKRNLAGDDSKPADDKDAKDRDSKDKKEPAKKAEPATAEAAKPAAAKPDASDKPAAARSRRGAPAVRTKAPTKSPAKAAKKKSRR